MVQKTLESKLEGAVKTGDSDKVSLAKVMLASLLNKKD